MRRGKLLFTFIILILLGCFSLVWGADRGPIRSGETKSGFQLAGPSFIDTWTFNGNEGDRVLISAEPTSGSTAVYITLYPPGGGPAEIGRYQEVNHQLRQTGLYTIVIEEAGRDAEATYDITLLKLPDGPLSLGGDPDGGAIASGETLAPAGELSISDLDAFQFYGDIGDRVLISAEPTSGSTAIYITLYPPDGGPAEIGRYQEVNHQLRQTGLYTIVIEEAGRDAEATYDITLLKIPGALSSPGDPDGGAIASGEILAPAGELSISDLDAFQFYGDTGDRVLISAEPTSGSTAIYITLYPPDGGPAEIGRYQEVDHQLRQTGLYTIVIEEAGRDAEATYNLSLAKIPSQLRPGLYNPFPANGSIISDLSDFFSWDPVPGATGYDVYFGEDVVVPLPRIRNNISSPSTPFPAMNPGRVYYWHVVARTSGGNIEGPYWWFSTVGFGFVDVAPGSNHEASIYAIYNAGITTGCAQNPLRFCPQDPVTRAQMAAFIIRALEGEPPSDYCDTGSPFPDVDPNLKVCKYIKRLSELEITTGYPDGTYQPYNNVTRAQMAAFIVRAKEGEPPSDYCDTGSPFPDVAANSPTCKYIKRFFELGITTGYSDGTYRPGNNVIRRQMAAFLDRAFLQMD